MTRKKFNGLRRALITKMCEMYDPNQKPNYAELKNCKPDMKVCGSYAGAWEMLKPARNLVGM